LFIQKRARPPKRGSPGERRENEAGRKRDGSYPTAASSLPLERARTARKERRRIDYSAKWIVKFETRRAGFRNETSGVSREPGGRKGGGEAERRQTGEPLTIPTPLSSTLSSLDERYSDIARSRSSIFLALQPPMFSPDRNLCAADPSPSPPLKPGVYPLAERRLRREGG